MKTKVCAKCKKELPISEFGVNNATLDGLMYTCKECTNNWGNKERSIRYIPVKNRDFSNANIEFIKANAGKITINAMIIETNLTRVEINYILEKYKLPNRVIKHKAYDGDPEVIREKEIRNQHIKELIKEKPMLFESELDKILWEIEQSNNKYDLSK